MTKDANRGDGGVCNADGEEGGREDRDKEMCGGETGSVGEQGSGKGEALACIADSSSLQTSKIDISRHRSASSATPPCMPLGRMGEMRAIVKKQASSRTLRELLGLTLLASGDPLGREGRTLCQRRGSGRRVHSSAPRARGGGSAGSGRGRCGQRHEGAACRCALPSSGRSEGTRRL